MNHPARGAIQTNTANGTPIISEELGCELIAEVEKVIEVSVRALLAAGEDVSDLGPLGRCVLPDRDIANKLTEQEALDDVDLRRSIDACTSMMAKAWGKPEASTPAQLVHSRADLLTIMLDRTEREFLQSFTNMLPSEDARNDFVNQGLRCAC